MQHSLKSGGTKDHFKQVKVPDSPRNENLNLLVQIKFLNLFIIYNQICPCGHLY
jgi:hypothetical protein